MPTQNFAILPVRVARVALKGSFIKRKHLPFLSYVPKMLHYTIVERSATLADVTVTADDPNLLSHPHLALVLWFLVFPG